MFITAVLLWSRNRPPYTAAVLISAASPKTLKSGQLRLNSVDISSQDLNMVTRWRPTGTWSESEYEGLKKKIANIQQSDWQRWPQDFLYCLSEGSRGVERLVRSAAKQTSLKCHRRRPRGARTIKSSFTRIQTVTSVFHPLPVCSEKNKASHD